MRQKFGVLGSPISHSLSPAIHTAAFSRLGRSADYVLVETANLSEWFPKHALEFSGLSLTMPLKEQAFQFADEIDAVAHFTRSINTMVPSASGWVAFNTDPEGIRYAISTNRRFSGASRAVVLGTGATARSAAYSLHQAGIGVSVWGRNLTTAEAVAALGAGDVAESFNQAIGAEFVVSTLPMGVLAQLLPQGFAPEGVLLDVGYRPWPTPAAKIWMKQGEAISVLEMLVGQAIVAQRIFNYANPFKELPDETGLLAAMHAAALRE